MNDLVKARMKRDTTVHWKERTAWAARCGATPTTTRGGWFFATMDSTVNCRECERLMFRLAPQKLTA